MATANMRPPDDAAYTGPRVATATLTEDAVTKHGLRDRFIVNRTTTGLYYAGTGEITLPTTAQTAPAAHAWITNPVGSGVQVAIRRVKVIPIFIASVIASDAPRILAELITFTGTLSAGQITAAKRKSTDAAAVATMSTASTGLTITTGAGILSWLPPVQFTTGAAAPRVISQNDPDRIWEPPPEEQIILGAGEGIAFRQPDAAAGGASARAVVIRVNWEEFTGF